MINRELLNEALKQAIEIRDENLIIALLKKGAKVDIDSFDYIPSLMKAVEGKDDTKQYIIEKEPALTNEVVLMLCKNIKMQIDKNEIAKSYLDEIIWYFVRDGVVDKEFLQNLINMGFSINLALVENSGNADINSTKTLLELGADINYESDYLVYENLDTYNIMQTPLHFALTEGGDFHSKYADECWSEENLLKYFKFLVSNGASKKVMTEALPMCCEAGFVNLAIFLIKNGADINYIDGNGRNALMNFASYQVWCDETDNFDFYNLKNKREFHIDWERFKYCKEKMNDEKYLKSRKALIKKLVQETKDLSLEDNDGWNVTKLSRLNNNLDIVEQLREEIKKYAWDNPYNI